jgi:hypothetical protein
LIPITINADRLAFHDPLDEAEDGKIRATRRTVDREIAHDGHINNQTGMNMNNMVPQVVFSIELVFETEIYLAFFLFITLIFLSNKVDKPVVNK